MRAPMGRVQTSCCDQSVPMDLGAYHFCQTRLMLMAGEYAANLYPKRGTLLDRLRLAVGIRPESRQDR